MSNLSNLNLNGNSWSYGELLTLISKLVKTRKPIRADCELNLNIIGYSYACQNLIDEIYLFYLTNSSD